MKASLQHIANDPITYSVRLHEDEHGDPLFLDDYSGLAVVVRRGDLGVVQGFCAPGGYDKAAREAIRVALKEAGVKKVRAARSVEVPTE